MCTLSLWLLKTSKLAESAKQIATPNKKAEKTTLSADDAVA
jgi:hypothetical protein